MEGERHVKLREVATPFAQTTPRQAVLSLLPIVKAELECMAGALGHHFLCGGTNRRCVAIVAVSKPDGKVQICVDLTKLNEIVERE